MSERRASMGDKVYRGDVVKYIRNNISLQTFMHRTVAKADEACWNLCDQLNFVPAIEEEPTRMKGKWVKQIDEPINAWWYECSVCGDYPLKNAFGHDSLSQFCPWCGAEMSEGEEEC